MRGLTALFVCAAVTVQGSQMPPIGPSSGRVAHLPSVPGNGLTSSNFSGRQGSVSRGNNSVKEAPQESNVIGLTDPKFSARRETIGNSVVLGAHGVNHLPAARSVNHLPGASRVNHLPGASSVNHLPAASSVNHLPAASSVNHLPAASSVNHLPAASSVNHLPAASSGGLMGLSHPEFKGRGGSVSNAKVVSLQEEGRRVATFPTPSGRSARGVVRSPTPLALTHAPAQAMHVALKPTPASGARGPAVKSAATLKLKSTASGKMPPAGVASIGGSRGPSVRPSGVPLKWKTTVVQHNGSVSPVIVGGSRGPAVHSVGGVPLKWKSAPVEVSANGAKPVYSNVDMKPVVKPSDTSAPRGSFRGSLPSAPQTVRMYEYKPTPSVFTRVYNQVFGVTKPTNIARAAQDVLSKPNWNNQS